MSQQDGYSPSFKRPEEVLRMRRSRSRGRGSQGSRGSARSPTQGGEPRPGVRPFSPGPLLQQPRSAGTKRRNPFAHIENTYSPTKKRLYNEDTTTKTRGPGGLFLRDGLAEAETQDQQDQQDHLKHLDQLDHQNHLNHLDQLNPLDHQNHLKHLDQLEHLDRQEHLNHLDHQEPQDISTKVERLPFSEDDSLFEEEEEEDVKSPLLKSPSAIAPASITPPVCTEYPADWSLKTRLLFTSPLTLSWAEHPKAQEEAFGLRHHCRAEFSALPHSLQDPRSCAALRSAFQQSLVYWQHPSLPWIPLFPRINAERNFSGRSTPWAQDRALQQSLLSEWSVSLSSLYGLLKARLCPYFYLCSYQFTVLFRAAGLGGSSSITAFISPTTRGLREAMKAEGIEFSLPLVEERRKSREQQNLSVQHEEEEEQCSELKEAEASQAGDEGENDDEEGSFSWLKEMGIQDQIKKPDSITMQLRKDGQTVSLDHKPESVVCVEGPHTFTLINFLINCKSVVAAAGSQAGLPPTLLAPSAFRGATMHTLKARSVNVKSRVGSTFQNISSLEITGPILPSSLHTVTTLLRSAQKGNFSAALYTHAPTAVMNTPPPTQQGSGGSVDLSACGLHPASAQQLQHPSSLGKTALTHINMSNYSYMWKN